MINPPGKSGNSKDVATMLALMALLAIAAGLLFLMAIVFPGVLGILLVVGGFFFFALFHYVVWGWWFAGRRTAYEDSTSEEFPTIPTEADS